MSKANALAGLIGNYGDSDEDSDDEVNMKAVHGKRSSVMDSAGQSYSAPPPAGHAYSAEAGAIHPAPILHCPWSACYDENSGFTYYWNQQTNAVTWEAPPEYLLALKLAQQQLNTSGSTEVSAVEWQLYQQALIEKQNTQTKGISKSKLPAVNLVKKTSGPVDNKSKAPAKRRISEDEDEKIELITSYHNSDSDSNDEQDTPVKPPVTVPVPVVAPTPPKLPKVQPKKPKTKSQPKEYGPELPPNQNYTVPIGPEIPPEFLVEPPKEEKNSTPLIVEEPEKPKVVENEDSQDESLLLTRLKDKAKLLEKLGGELPAELQEIIRDETNSKPSSPKTCGTETKPVGDIDDLLQEIEKKELPKVKTKTKIDIFSDEVKNTDSAKSSPRSNGNVTPPSEEIKPLFPSSQNIVDVPTTSLFPSTASIQENGVEKEVPENPVAAEKKGPNLYLMGAGEVIEPTRKKLRISNSVLPPKKVETPAYTTKYAQFIEGFTSERTGLGFSKDDAEVASPKNAISYGNGLMFTKGETLNEDKKDVELEDMTDLVEAKLKFLTQLQPTPVSPIQEMVIQLQTLSAAHASGALWGGYLRRWARAANAALRAHEAAAAPPGWRAAFLRSEGRYRYERESDGLVQWEYPAADHCDMDICTTPPPTAAGHKEESLPPLPPSPPPPPPPPARPVTPPPPEWHDPPPPGCDEATPPAPPLPPEPKQEIGDELLSFYNDIAELEKKTPSAPHTASNSPEPPLPPVPEHKERREREKERERKEREKEREREKEKDGKVKKKSKVKISSSIGMKQKSVSSLVAKWQQVAEEINSD